MRMAAYCRVSTDKEEQLESLGNQIKFFEDYAKQENHKLVKIYYDEGLSGAKLLKKRKDFLQLVKDSGRNKFDIIYVKDVTRFARNTVDFLQNIREIKGNGVEVYFISHNLGIQEGNEMYLTMLAMLAQEESANLSKKVKFGKNISAKNGRVPNFVYGYDKIDKYTLIKNEKEAEVIKLIFDLFVNQGYGAGRIANYLTENNIPTKKNKQTLWHQKVVTDLLKNQIYIGKIINKKSEVSDFLTGKRKNIPEKDWIIVENPEIRIIDDQTFQKAQQITKERKDSFNIKKIRDSTKYPFSNLIQCSECGYSFKRTKRQYTEDGNIYIKWVDSYRNLRGKNYCVNKTVIDEEKLLNAIKNFFQELIKNQNTIVKKIAKEIQKLINEQNQENNKSYHDIQKELNTLIKEKEKYMEMFTASVINMEELKKYTDPLNKQISKYQMNSQIINNREIINTNIEKAIIKRIQMVKSIVNLNEFNNEFLKTVIHKIIVYPTGDIKISLKIDPSNNIDFELPLEIYEIPLDDVDNTIPFTNYTPNCSNKMEWFLLIN